MKFSLICVNTPFEVLVHFLLDRCSVRRYSWSVGKHPAPWRESETAPPTSTTYKSRVFTCSVHVYAGGYITAHYTYAYMIRRVASSLQQQKG